MTEITGGNYPWHQPSWQQLSNYIDQQRIPQALMISGPKGLGKQQLAYKFANALICEQSSIDHQSCGHCKSCQLFKSKNHPDFNVIEPEEAGKKISINPIRELISFLSLTSVFSAYRIVIINNADQLTHAAANSFLKCLEEPSERTVIILITDNPALLPATIISRCQKLKMACPHSHSAKDWLEQQNITDDLDILLSLSSGAPLTARNYASTETLALRKKCFHSWLQISQQKINPVSLAEQWLQYPESMLLFWMTTWVIDTIKCYHHQKIQHFYNPDFSQNLQELAQQLELKGLFKFYQLLLKQQNYLLTQLNKQLIFEEILINWSQLNRVK